PHPAIALPDNLYGALRANSFGLDLANDQDLISLNNTAQNLHQQQWQAQPLGKNLTLENAALDTSLAPIAILNPAQHSDIVGYVHEASTAQVNQALENAAHAQMDWTATAKNER